MKVKQFAWAKTLQEYDFCVLFTAALVRGRKKKKKWFNLFFFQVLNITDNSKQ